MDIVNDNNRYPIQPLTSKIQVHINTPIGKVIARFQAFSGHFIAAKSGENKEATTLEIRTGSLDTDRNLIGMMLRGEKFFDVENFPSMRFVSSSFEWADDEHAALIGDLTIKSVTRKVIFHMELKSAENKTSANYSLEHISINASATIRCSDFELHRLASVISNTMSLNMEIDALKMDATAVDTLD